MKILILNGNPNPANNQFEEKLEIIAGTLKNDHTKTEIVKLRDLDMAYCTGCFNGWVKTPGQCIIKDDHAQVSKKYIHAGRVIFASPIMMGYVSSLMKKTLDRLISLLLPYITIINGEIHHVKRYETYPEIGVLYQKEQDTDQRDLEILKNLFSRLSINIHANLWLFHDMDAPLKPLTNEPMIYQDAQSQPTQKK